MSSTTKIPSPLTIAKSSNLLSPPSIRDFQNSSHQQDERGKGSSALDRQNVKRGKEGSGSEKERESQHLQILVGDRQTDEKGGECICLSREIKNRQNETGSLRLRRECGETERQSQRNSLDRQTEIFGCQPNGEKIFNKHLISCGLEKDRPVNDRLGESSPKEEKSEKGESRESIETNISNTKPACNMQNMHTKHADLDRSTKTNLLERTRNNSSEEKPNDRGADETKPEVSGLKRHHRDDSCRDRPGTLRLSVQCKVTDL